LEIARRIKRTAEKVTEIAPEIVQAMLDAKEVAAAAAERAEAAQAAVLAALGDAEAGLCGDLGAVTYLLQTRKGFVVEPTEFRVLRHKPKGL
jgi:hypothetical protein